MKKILVLGKTGMLGHMVFNYFVSLNKYSVMGTTRKEIDPIVMTELEIENKINSYKPDFVINCIGIINKYADKDERITYNVNSEFPHLLSYLGIKNKFKLIHVSSDCAFDDDVYGKSKLLGEINDIHNLTIRTSIIGPEIKEGFGLFHWFMSQEGKVNGFTKAFWDGVTTLELAKFINECITKNIKGLINYRTRKSVSKFELLQIISKVFDKKIEIIADNRDMKDKRELNSEYWCEKSYEQQLTEMKEFMRIKK
jgi:dTDP-4-dehydrorhamnose reductase